MNTNIVFVNRRKGNDRRTDFDPCKNLEVDLFHRKRRKTKERRSLHRTLTEDYYAYVQAKLKDVQALEEAQLDSLAD